MDIAQNLFFCLNSLAVAQILISLHMKFCLNSSETWVNTVRFRAGEARLLAQVHFYNTGLLVVSVGLLVGRPVFDSLAELDQKTLKVGIHIFPA